MGDAHDAAAVTAGLISDYARVAALGVKRWSDLGAQGPKREEYEEHDGPAHAALDRLLAHGFASDQHGAIVLMRPEDCPVSPNDPGFDRLLTCYRAWLCAGGGSPEGLADELLYGELGFWQHWWNRLREHDHARQGPLSVDIVVPDDGSFEVRPWLREFDPRIRSHVLDGGLVRGRAIVPPTAVKSIVEPMLDLFTESGFTVRVLSTDARFALYDSRSAVLSGPPEGHGSAALEPYLAVHREAIVTPLRSYFEVLWSAATPFRADREEHAEVLVLLARGLTDAQIARELNLSPRTVSRRVSEIMAEYGAASRFELGTMYARTPLPRLA